MNDALPTPPPAGPGLLLVHGTAGDSAIWEPMLPQWSDTRTVVAPDLAGAGSDEDPGELSVAGIAAQALAAADAAGLTEFDVVGHSLGAVVAAELAAAAPGRVRRLVLHAGWVRTDARQFAEFDHWIRLLRTEVDLFLGYLPLMAFGPRFWAAANESTTKELLALLRPGFRVAPTIRQIELDQRVDLTDRLAEISAPTLVLTSRHDRLIDCASQRALVSGITGATQAGLDAGHGAPAEDPAEFAAAVTAFLEEAR